MQSTVQQLIDRLTARANSDSSFASLLLKNPASAAESEFGRVPAGLALRANRTSNGQIVVTAEGSGNTEMSIEELESVVGGDGFPGPISLP